MMTDFINSNEGGLSLGEFVGVPKKTGYNNIISVVYLI